MSGGQQQRVAVVRAIAAHPLLVLADEPTANLDSETSAALLDVMSELNQEQGVTLSLLVSRSGGHRALSSGDQARQRGDRQRRAERLAQAL